MTNKIVVNLQTGEQAVVAVPADELAQQQQEHQEFLQSVTYADKRQREYPSIGDQLDALWKGGDAAAEMLAKVQAVKAKYPKG